MIVGGNRSVSRVQVVQRYLAMSAYNMILRDKACSKFLPLNLVFFFVEFDLVR
jgi:hypothetical protein